MDCEHYIIEDEFHVCSKCGLVFDNICKNKETYFIPEQYYHEITNKEKDLSMKIIEIVFHFNLPSGLINELQNSINKDCRKICDDEKLAIHFYEKCLQYGNCIRLNDICAVCQVNPSKVAKHASKKTYFQSEDVLNKIGRLLNLTSCEIKQVEDKYKLKQLNGHNPFTEAAAFIYHNFKHKLSLTQVCQAANINPVSIRRYIVKYITPFE